MLRLVVLLLLAPALAASDALGPLPADTVLIGVDEHPEYERWHLRTDREFVIELTRARPGSGAVCSGGGVDLWVRLDAAKEGESFVWDPLPAVVTQACGRLAEHAPALGERADVQEPREPRAAPPVSNAAAPAPDAPPWRGVGLLALGTALGAAWVLARGGRWAWGTGVLALALRWGLGPRTVLLGGDAAYERLNSLRRPMHSALYGDGYPLLLGPLARLLDPHFANQVVSALTAAFGAVLLRRHGVHPAGALAVALLPLAVALSGMEDAFVVVGALQVLALAGPPIVTVLAGALLAYTRPEQAVFVLVPVALLLRERRWGLTIALCATCAPRWIELAAGLGHARELLQPERAADVGWWRQLLPGRGAVWIGVDPWLVPAATLPLALFGAWRRRSLGLTILAALLAGLAPIVTKSFPGADPLRFQLASAQWLALLAGVGIVEARWVGAPLYALTALLTLNPTRGPWAWQAEYDWLRVHLRTLPDGADLWLDTSQDPNHAMREWIEAQARVHTQDATFAVPPAGAWVYRGTADVLAGRPVGDLQPIDVTSIPPATDGWVDLGTEPVEIGLYRVP